jgi:hypothetical protein
VRPARPKAYRSWLLDQRTDTRSGVGSACTTGAIGIRIASPLLVTRAFILHKFSAIIVGASDGPKWGPAREGSRKPPNWQAKRYLGTLPQPLRPWFVGNITLSNPKRQYARDSLPCVSPPISRRCWEILTARREPAAHLMHTWTNAMLIEVGHGILRSKSYLLTGPRVSLSSVPLCTEVPRTLLPQAWAKRLRHQLEGIRPCHSRGSCPCNPG